MVIGDHTEACINNHVILFSNHLDYEYCINRESPGLYLKWHLENHEFVFSFDPSCGYFGVSQNLS